MFFIPSAEQFYAMADFINLIRDSGARDARNRKGLFMEQKSINNSIYDSPDFLPFTNNNIFMNVMRRPKICRGILELALPNEEFGGNKDYELPASVS